MAKIPAPLVVNLDRDRLVICAKDQKSVFTFAYPATAIRDLEIVNFDALHSQLSLFLQSHHLLPSPVIFVMSSRLCFEQDLTSTAKADRFEASRQFAEAVPFSSVSYRTFAVGPRVLAIAINRDFYEGLKTSFESLAFSVVAVIPAAVLAPFKIKDALDPSVCLVVYRNSAYVKQNNFLTSVPAADFRSIEQQFLKKHQTLVLILILTFVMTAVLVAYVTLTPARPLPFSQTLTPPRLPISSPSPPATSIETPASSLSVQILNGSRVAGLASRVQNLLSPLGFVRFQLGNSTAQASTTSVIFSPRVSPSLKTAVISQLESLFSTVTSLEKSGDSVDILITTGQSS